MSKLESIFATQLRYALNLDVEREYRFHPVRKWRFDFALPDLLIAMEVEGLSRTVSRHTTFEGYRRDCEKYNNAAILGWIVLRFTDREIKRGTALNMVEHAIEVRRDGRKVD